MSYSHFTKIRYALALVFFIFIQGCSWAEKNGSNNRIITYFAGDTGDQKPWSIGGAYGVKAPLYRSIFTQPLYRLSSGKVSTGLIKEWTWEYPTKSFVVSLDSAYTYPDGSSISAEDIEFSILKFYLAKSNKSPTPPWYFGKLKGIDKLGKGSFRSGLCECVQVMSQHKMRIFITNNEPKFMENFSDFIFPISKPTYFDTDFFSFKGIPKGTGFYDIVDYVPENKFLTLRMKKKYVQLEKYKNSPRLIKYVVGGNDWSYQPDIVYGEGSKRLNSQGGYRNVRTSNPWGAYLLSFNYENEYGAQKVFRRIVSLSVDRKALTKNRDNVQPFDGLFLNPKFSINEKPREFSPRLAQKLREKKNPSLVKSKKPLRAVYYSPTKPSQDPEVIKKLEKQFLKVGLNVDFRPYDFENLKIGEHPHIVMYYIGKVFPYNDIMFPLYQYIEPDEQSMTFDRSNSLTNKLYSRARESIGEERRKIVQQLADYFHQNTSQVTLMKGFDVFQVKKKIKDLGIDSYENLVEFHKVSLAAPDR